MVNPVRNLKYALVLATLASFAATVGDFLMLYVVNAGGEMLHLPPPGTAVLFVGYVLGIFAIPLYGVGFWAVAKILAAETPLSGQVVLVSGVIMAVLGGIIHGVTGISIEAQVRTGEIMKEPLAGVLEYGVYLLPLWAIASVLSCIVSVGFAWGILNGQSRLPRSMSLFNPVLLTVFFTLAGTATPMLKAFLVPAAPNVAHLVFFALTTVFVFKDSQQENQSFRNPV
jgi:uncharacterized protein DUF6796